jgi:DNA-binding MarR family transcriptional regulator
MKTDTSHHALMIRRELLAQQLVLVLPGFGRWASAMRDFETPYGKAGIRQLEVLYILRHDFVDPSQQTATMLADYFQIQRSVVTRVLAKLEHGGYITRETDPHDHRSQQITITELGKQLSDYVEQKYFEEMNSALGDITEEDLISLERSLTILTKVSANLGLGDPPPRDHVGEALTRS